MKEPEYKAVIYLKPEIQKLLMRADFHLQHILPATTNKHGIAALFCTRYEVGPQFVSMTVFWMGTLIDVQIPVEFILMIYAPRDSKQIGFRLKGYRSKRRDSK